MRDVQDHYFREAKREGYLSRAAYKLIEIDDRKKVIRAGDRVLDCGCAPGSWLQVAAARAGTRGMVVGIDLLPIKFRAGNVQTIEGDFTAVQPAVLLERLAKQKVGSPPPFSPVAPVVSPNERGGSSGAASLVFDVILSDMAPKTTGDPSGDHHRSVRLCESLLDRCGDLLRPGGNLVMKVFEGEAYSSLMKRAAGMFESAKGYKPKASRSESAEMYIVAGGFNPPPRNSQAVAQPKRSRSTGWNSR